ncbi:MAG: hypothetical protein ACC650_08015 [Gammaproteobacteria bacterium]
MIRLKVLKKTTILVFLLLFSGSQIVGAQTKIYQYDGKLPFVQMMLNMMVAMGILDRLPNNGAYGAFSNSASPWSRYTNPYSRALALQGISPAFANNPFLRSPWSQSPWTASIPGGVSPVWGSPDWGVLPLDSYSYNRYAPYGSQWSSTDLDGWVNEPWETSGWNHEADSKKQSQQSVQQQPQVMQPSAPIVQNFNYNMPESTQQNTGQQNSRQKNNRQENNQQDNRSNRQSPLAKLQQPRRPNWRPGGPATSRSKNQASPRQKTKPQYRKQKPCVTDFCGLKKPNLNGLWVSQDGEMLGIKNKHYLWTDGNSRYLTGQLKVQNEYLLANIDGHKKLMRFKYKLAGNHLLTMQPDGKIREFVRLPNNQFAGQYSGQYPGYGQSYGPNYEAYYR